MSHLILHPSSFLLFLLLALASFANAEVKLNPLFTDHMVLQREAAVPVWGTADPGEKVSVSFGGQSATATADDCGNWKAELAALSASDEARQLVVKGSNTITVDDVVVGDVWLASGQSNMDSPLRSGSAADALPGANDPLLRFFHVTKAVAAEPQAAAQGGPWQTTTPETAKDFSAVAYFFAQQIRETQKVPVGVIRAAWGGTPIKTWMSLASLEQDPAMTSLLAEWQTAREKYLATKDRPDLMEEYYRAMKDWETNVEPAFKAARQAHGAAVAAAKAAGQPAPAAPQPERPEPQMPNPIAMPSATKRPSVPTITYNGMIAPLAPYGLKGIIWYQGEADASRGPEYGHLFPRLIESWREDFGKRTLPFLYVQLPAYGTDTALVASQGIPFLRAAQAAALQLPGTGMAVTLDIGEAKDAHPDNKIHVGRRLALLARRSVYGENVADSGPVYQSHEIKDGAVHVKFDHIGGGLVIARPPWRAASMPEVPEDKLVGFAVRGADGQWVEAEARIEDDAVIVSSPDVTAPQSVAYGWTASPSVNFYNKEGLPAAPFRTDDQ
jgi:sialate O-acetylesterase